MEILANGIVVLKRLTVADSEAFYELYTSPEVSKHFDLPPFLPHEIAHGFTRRIIASCAFIWTIRLVSEPEKIIGDAALHHYEQKQKTIEIGGSLLPEYWGKNLMIQALELVCSFAEQTLKIEQIIGKTTVSNSQAVRMVEKLGFQKIGVTENELILRKTYRQYPIEG